MSAERDLAEAILAEMCSNHTADTAWALFREHTGLSERDRIRRALHYAIASAIETVLARRQREAARSGPWDGPQEEDGYPGSLLPPKRGAP